MKISKRSLLAKKLKEKAKVFLSDYCKKASLALVFSEKLPHLLNFYEDLFSLEAASKIQLKVLAEEMQAINKGLERVNAELDASKSDGPVSETFVKVYLTQICS
ncbi:hypothetical protein AgCh_033866 [Apium graveolens]